MGLDRDPGGVRFAPLIDKRGMAMDSGETIPYAVSAADVEVEHVPQHAVLRDLLRSREWVDAATLRDVIGHRFAATLFLVRNGLDGGPAWDIEGRRMPASHMYEYRWTGGITEPGQPRRVERCPTCGHRLPARARARRTRG